MWRGELLLVEKRTLVSGYGVLLKGFSYKFMAQISGRDSIHRNEKRLNRICEKASGRVPGEVESRGHL